MSVKRIVLDIFWIVMIAAIPHYIFKLFFMGSCMETIRKMDSRKEE